LQRNGLDIQMLAKSLSRLTSSIFPRPPVPQRARPGSDKPEAAPEERAEAGGWFESSYDLNRGIEVAELDWFDMTPPPGWPISGPQVCGPLQ
jgi:hypothetical protein